MCRVHKKRLAPQYSRKQMQTFASLLQLVGLGATFWAVWSIAGTALFLGAFGIFALLVGLALERTSRSQHVRR